MIFYKSVYGLHKMMQCDQCKKTIDLTMGGGRIIKDKRDYCSAECLAEAEKAQQGREG